MKLKQTYVIEFTDRNQKFYIKKLIKYDLGFRIPQTTKEKEKSLIWKNKKSIDKVVKDLNNGLFQPGFDKDTLSTFTYTVVNITPKKILRKLKLKKIMRKNKHI